MRKDSESISEYVMSLRKLSEHCNFADKLHEHIRDRLVCGVRSEKIQQRLLSEKGLTLDRALELAMSMEAAARHTREITGKGDTGTAMDVFPVNRFERRNSTGAQSMQRRECYRCGSASHLADTCPFKDKECFACSRIGHTRRKCRANEKKDKEGRPVKQLDLTWQLVDAVRAVMRCTTALR